MHERFIEAVMHLFPGQSVKGILVDHRDGEGLQIAAWPFEGEPPTDAQVEALLPAIDAAKVSEQRRAAYAAEVDGLGLRALALQAQKDPAAPAAVQEWLDARAAVQARFPQPGAK